MLTLALGSLTGKSGERDGGRQEVGDKKGVEKKNVHDKTPQRKAL